MTNLTLFALKYVFFPIQTRVFPSSQSFQFGEAVALYFAFLASYTRSLFFIAVVGLICYFFRQPYSITYSSLLFLWSVVFVEYWRIRERLYAVTWGCRGAVRVEKHLPTFIEGRPWWQRELKILASLPVIALFASILAVLLTIIFIFEAFVTTLYTGPGHEYVVRSSFSDLDSLYLTLLSSSVICAHCPFHRRNPSVPRNLSELRTKANTMGESRTPVEF
jgi:hypothetical protein